ncbi:uncharacterized protein LOC133816492 [Humulus lupulus]|uniref:uncharacterized protein LOC133816492 n=1 Tax=Humulus lupulus TaxID=3486 RepID=UPI002B405CAE|nr:uncharacterized protein LOC133816492 [Humulus lupulus]
MEGSAIVTLLLLLDWPDPLASTPFGLARSSSWLDMNGGVCNEDTECVGFARIGSEDQIIVAGTMKQLQLHVFFLSNSNVGVCNYSNFDVLLCKKLNSSIFCAESSNFSIC